MKKTFCLLLSVFLLLCTTSVFTLASDDGAAEKGFLIATDYIDASSQDVSGALQALIDSNPNRTIYFPDGTYRLSNSVITPADPRKSVDLRLSNYAVLKANSDFRGEAVVRLGGKDPYNSTRINGSNYSLTGGIIDGSSVTNGISIDSGRETKVCDVSVKNTVVGIHVKYGANSGSSDSDVRDCNIIGTGGTDSVGILLDGYDNTVTNVRIGSIHTGVLIRSAGNSLTNLHPLCSWNCPDYDTSCGFYDECGNNTYNYCYSDQFCTGFYVRRGCNIYTDCFAYWYSSAGGKETVFRTDNAFDSLVSGIHVGFRDDTENYLLITEKIGSGCLDRVDFNPKNCKGYFTYEWYMKDSALYSLKCLYFNIQRFFRSAFNG